MHLIKPKGMRRMASEMRVSKLKAKPHDTPDELRSSQKTKVGGVRLKKYAIGWFKLDPGWKRSDGIKPAVKLIDVRPRMSAIVFQGASKSA
jgi:hypothetical protein